MIQPSSISGSGTLAQQLARVGMLRVGEDRRRVAFLDQFARRQHRDPVAEHAHHREIVADEDQRQVEVVAEPAEEEEDLRLGRDVEAGDDLVGDDELGLERQRPGDADALALAAGQLVRVAAEKRGRQPDDVEQLGRALPPCRPVAAAAESLERPRPASCRWSAAG